MHVEQKAAAGTASCQVARTGPGTELRNGCLQAAQGIKVSQQAVVHASVLRESSKGVWDMARTWSAGKNRDSMRAGFS